MRRAWFGRLWRGATASCRAGGRILRRVGPPLAMAATLVALGVLSWPSAVTDTAGPPVTEAPAPQTTTSEPARFGAATDLVPETVVTRPAKATTSTSFDLNAEPCFTPLFRDDFDDEKLDPAWEVYDSDGNHSPHAVRKAEAVTTEDGILVITAANDDDGVLTSGGLRLNHPQIYGRYSFRVRTDPDLTNATSGVVLTWPVSESQSLDGENNIYETLRAPGSRAPFYSFIHEPFDQSADGISQVEFTHLGDATEWQELSMEWTPGYLSVTWTEPSTGERTTQRVEETEQDNITDAEHFLAIQLDLFKGSFPDERVVQMEVDWVEVDAYCG